MGTSSSRHQKLTEVDNTEQIFTWEITLIPANGHLNKSTSVWEFTLFGNECDKTGALRGRFYLGDFESWHGPTASYGIRGMSLWLKVAKSPTWEDAVLSLKIRKRVEGETEVTWERHVLVTEMDIQLEQHFLVWALMKRTPEGGWKETNLYTNSGRILHARVDISCKLLWVKGPGAMEVGLGDAGKKEASGLLRDLKRLGADEGLADVVLQTKDGMILKAHKVILAARSPYFRRYILWSPHQFSGDQPVRFDDVNGRPLMAILHWMYTGLLMDDVDVFMEELVEVAKKFEMTDLLKMLEQRKKVCGGKDGSSEGVIMPSLQEKQDVRKLKRAILAWFPLLRFQFGNRPVGLVASVINGVHGLYELFL